MTERKLTVEIPEVRTIFTDFSENSRRLWLSEILAWPLCRNVSGMFVVYILEDFAEDFAGGLFWALSPTKKK